MKLLMHVLKRNEKLNIDNRLINNYGIGVKLEEEYKEVMEALVNYNKNSTLDNLKELVRETYDLIQMCILILWKCHRNALSIDEPNLIQNINIEHKDKLITERCWEIETGIEIDIKG